MKIFLKNLLLLALASISFAMVAAQETPQKKALRYITNLFDARRTNIGPITPALLDDAINILTAEQATLLHKALQPIQENIEKAQKAMGQKAVQKSAIATAPMAKVPVRSKAPEVRMRPQTAVAGIPKNPASSAAPLKLRAFSATGGENQKEEEQKISMNLKEKDAYERGKPAIISANQGSTASAAAPLIPTAISRAKPQGAKAAKAPFMRIPEFSKAVQLLEPLDVLAQDIIAMGTQFAIPQWQEAFEQFNQRVATMRQAIATIQFKDLDDAGDFLEENQWALLTLLGLKPVYSYSYPILYDYPKFKIILDAFRSDKALKILPAANYPKKLPKQEAEYALKQNQMPMLLMHDPLIPLSKVVEWYPTAKLTTTPPDHIQQWATYTFEQRMKLLEQWTNYMYQAWLKRVQGGKEAFTGNPFEEIGHTEDEVAIILGFQPLAWKKITKQTGLQQWIDFNDNQGNYRALLRGGQVDFSDNSPYMQLTGKLFEYTLRTVAGDDVYIFTLASALSKMLFAGFNSGEDIPTLTAKLQQGNFALLNFIQDVAKVDIAKGQTLPDEPTNKELATLITNFLQKVKIKVPAMPLNAATAARAFAPQPAPQPKRPASAISATRVNPKATTRKHAQ